MKTKRHLSLTLSGTLLATLAVVLLLRTGATAQGNPSASSVQLVSIAAITTGAPQINFTFNQDISSYSASTYQLTAISNGVPSASEPTVASLAQGTKVLSVPLDLKSLATNQDQAVWISVTIGNAENPNILTTPTYILDLSFLASSAAYRSTILTLTQTQQTLQNSLSQCKTNLAAVGALNPAALNYAGPALVGDTSLILHFTTSTAATIQVTETKTGQTKTDTGTDHYVKFENLSPSTSYAFTASALDVVTKKPILTQPINQATAQSVTFSPIFQKLSASGPNGLVATINFDLNQGLPPNFKSYIKLYYQAKNPDGTWGQKMLATGDGDLDANGIPQGTAYTSPYAAPQTFQFSVPLPNTEYLVTFVAYDQYGDEPPPGPGRSVSTPQVTPALAFNGPISLSMNTNTGLTVSWSATRVVKTSTLQIKLPNGTFQPDIPPGTTGSTNSSVTININGLNALVQASKPASSSDSASSTSKPIEFDITMDDGTNSPTGKAAISFTVQFVIASTKKPTTPIQTAANKVAKSATGSSKITWSDVGNAGLSIIATIAKAL